MDRLTLGARSPCRQARALDLRRISRSVWRPVLAAVCILLAISTPASSRPRDESRAAASELLQKAKSEEDPAKRVATLNKALTYQSLRGWILSSILLERAMAHKELKDYYRAIEDFTSALAHSPRAFPALIEKAECLIMVDQLDEASRDLEYYLLTKPGTARAYVLKGMIYEKEGFLGKAEDEFTRALHYESASTLALDARAKVLVREGKPRRALEDMDDLIRIVRDRPDYYMTRARICVKLKDYASALKDYGRVLSLSPGDDRVMKEKVLVYFKTNQPQKALDVLSGFASKGGQDAEARVLQARAHILLKHYDKAERILNDVLGTVPGYAPAYLYSGMVLIRRNRPDEALSRLNRAIALDSSFAEAYKERARIFIGLGELVRAATDLTSAVNLDPADGELFALRGFTSLKRMLYDAAIADFTRALESLPGDPRINYDRAVAFVLRDENEAALKDLETVLRAQPDSGRALALKGVAHFALGEKAAAREDLDKAVAASAGDPVIWNNRGFFLHKIGDEKGAMESFNRALRLDAAYARARYNLGLALNKEEAPPLPDEAQRRPSGAESVPEEKPSSNEGR